jgi:hypothetical protein
MPSIDIWQVDSISRRTIGLINQTLKLSQGSRNWTLNFHSSGISEIANIKLNLTCRRDIKITYTFETVRFLQSESNFDYQNSRIKILVSVVFFSHKPNNVISYVQPNQNGPSYSQYEEKR